MVSSSRRPSLLDSFLFWIPSQQMGLSHGFACPLQDSDGFPRHSDFPSSKQATTALLLFCSEINSPSIALAPPIECNKV